MEEQQIRIEHILNTNDGHGITRVNPHYVLRFTNFIEPMVSIFSSYLLVSV